MMNLLLKGKRFNQVEKLLLYITVCSAGLIIMFYPTIISGFSSIQTDPGDTRLVNYILEHSFQLLVNRNYVGSLWSPTFFFPYKNALTFSESLFGSAPLYWFFRAIFKSDLAFQLWAIAICILNFVSFAFLMRRYQVSRILTTFGAFLFAFSMPRVGQLAHPQLLPQFFTPLVFLVGWEFIKQPTRKRLALVLLLSYLQVMAGIYLGWFLLFSLLIFFGITYGLYSETRIRFLAYWKSDFKAIITIILGWIALMVLSLFPYLETKAALGARRYSEIDLMLPRFASWFSAPPGSMWSSFFPWISKDLPLAHEHYMFAGFTLVLLTALCAITQFSFKNILPSEKTVLVKTCLLVFVTIFCLSLRLPSGLSLWRIVYEVVPGASVIRGVTRIWTIAYFYLLIAVILSLDSLIKSVVTQKRSRLVIVSIVCLLGVSEQFVLNLPSYEKAPYLKQEVELSHIMKEGCNIAYFSLNPEVPYFVDQISAMWAGMNANVPVVNGYSGNVPPNYGDNTKSMSVAQVVHWLEPVTTKKPEKVCIVYPKTLAKPDSLISTYAIQKAPKLSDNFASYTLQLPLPQVFSQEIKFFEIPQIAEPTSIIKLPVIVKNTSNFFWSPKGNNPTNFSYRWIDSNGHLVIFDGDGDRTRLNQDLAPGEALALNTAIRTPNIPGRYTLILTMVQEEVAWFNDVTNSPKIPVEVIARQ